MVVSGARRSCASPRTSTPAVGAGIDVRARSYPTAIEADTSSPSEIIAAGTLHGSTPVISSPRSAIARTPTPTMTRIAVFREAAAGAATG